MMMRSSSLHYCSLMTCLLSFDSHRPVFKIRFLFWKLVDGVLVCVVVF